MTFLARKDRIVAHYRRVWGTAGRFRQWTTGPVHELPPDFGVLEMEPTEARGGWVYATVAMSRPGEARPLELHLFSPVADKSIIELLTVIAHYHRTGAKLGLGHTVNFGRPWLPGSDCDHGLISLPYHYGPDLEELSIGDEIVRCLWLIPITRAERQFKMANGLEALESAFEEAGVAFIDPLRSSVVGPS
jgi:hypothetical protein